MAAGTLALARDDLPEAARCRELTAEAAQNANRPPACVAICLAFAANRYSAVGQLGKAKVLAERAITVAEPTNMPTAMVQGRLALGVAIAESNPARAQFYLGESLVMSTRLDYAQEKELQSAAFLASYLHDDRATLELARKAIDHLRWTGDQANLVVMLELVSAALASSKPEAATAIARASVAIRQRAIGSAPCYRTLESVRDFPLNVDEAITYALSEIGHALNELISQR